MKTLRATIEFPVTDDCDMSMALLRLSVQLREMSREAWPDAFVWPNAWPEASDAGWRLDAKFEG